MDEKIFNKLKREYAKTIVKHGVNIKKNECVLVDAQFDQIDFVNMVVEECYKAGAKRVLMRWNDMNIERLHIKYQSIDTIKEALPFEKDFFNYLLKNKISNIIIDGCHVGAFNNLDVNKVNERNKLAALIQKEYSQACDGIVSWTIACVPSKEWAKKVFPSLNEQEGKKKLWEMIFKICRIEKKSSVKSWKKHDANLKKRASWLNNLDIASLHYSSNSGTDLTVEIIPNTAFIAGSHYNLTHKKYFNPNFPTEEIFTSPHRLKTRGVVCSTRPFIYNSFVIDKARFEFNEGKIINATAEVGNDILQHLLNHDENSKYLGEIALVPYNSPINSAGILFYETMYDENASCHLAFGDSFKSVHRDYANLNREQLLNEGLNSSNIHVDFMMGASDLNIVAKTRNGQEVAIFKNGDWAN